jgi:hypothetical protein
MLEDLSDQIYEVHHELLDDLKDQIDGLQRGPGGILPRGAGTMFEAATRLTLLIAQAHERNDADTARQLMEVQTMLNETLSSYVAVRQAPVSHAKPLKLTDLIEQDHSVEKGEALEDVGNQT